MIKKKIFFGIFVLYFLVLIIAFSFAQNAIIVIPSLDSLINSRIFNSSNQSTEPISCYPEFPSDPTVIFRVDDIQANTYQDIRFKIMDDILERNMSLVAAVIPKNLESDTELKRYLIRNRVNPNFEIALHGLQHLPEEFKNFTFEEAYAALNEGLSKIYENTGIKPVTFIPPSNEYSQGTIEALNELDFQIISAKKDEYFLNGGIFHIGKTTETYDFANSRFLSANEVIDACLASLDSKKLCMVTIHPQDYLDENDDLDKDKYNEFIKILDQISNLNVKFKAPRDFLSCYE